MATDKTHDAFQLRVPSEEETAALLHTCADPCERATLGLLAEAGLRPREVCGLRVGDILHDALRVRGKDGCERVVALNPQLTEALHRCLHERGGNPAAGEALLLVVDGRPLDIQVLGGMVRAVAGRAGLSDWLSAHALRAGSLARRHAEAKRTGAAGSQEGNDGGSIG